MGILQVTPEQAVAGTPITISGSHLPANAKVELTWSTANATWMVQAEPDTVNYLGSADKKFAVVLATTTTSAKGTLQRVAQGARRLRRAARHLRRHQG